ncbi:MAG: pilin [Planctomycetota bacterium]|jgi:type IV pilus assembly protein PilA
MKKKGFTLIELMVVILIVGILAAASIPLMRGRIDSAKWAEANAMAGTIKSAVRVTYAESGSITTGKASDNLTTLGFSENDLTGTYFVAADFTVDGSNATDITVTVVGDGADKTPEGTYVLQANGDWDKQ